ncbi:MAG: flagellar biosynthetic protein FliO [Pseudomonadota bacterium]|nr:flagellar biosynthetic protein FliO [Pseudomonadota bacterium]
MAGLLDMTLGLAVVLAAIAAAAWLVRRLAPWQAAQGAVRVLGGVTLGSRERVVLVQVEDVRLLLGIAPGRVQTLHVFPPAPRTPAGGPAAAREEYAYEATVDRPG